MAFAIHLPMTTKPMTTQQIPNGLFALIACGTMLGIAGTDLVLPAIPGLAHALGGTVETAQLVLAAYVFGTLIGLLGFGELGARIDPRQLLVWSLALFALISFAAAASPSLQWLIALRCVQGAVGACAAVFAPGFINVLYPPDRAAHMLGRLGSIESLAPALAPIAGVYLLSLGGWSLSFLTLGILGAISAAATWLFKHALPASPADASKHQGYWSILRRRRFLGFAFSQSFSLGSLLIFVFGAPTVMTQTMGLTLSHFVILQLAGIAMFIIGANLSSQLAVRFGVGRVIFLGTLAIALAFVGILAVASLGASAFAVIVVFWMMVNLGFGVRGPVGFHQAILAAEGDHSRGAALVIAGILSTAALGTAIMAPFIGAGLWALALAGAVVAFSGLAALMLIRT
jgi:predicted MFS family arabinose efflux permease